MLAPVHSSRARNVLQRLNGGDLLLGAAALSACVCSQLSPDSIGNGPVICPFRRMTGLPCPGCGTTRAWVYATHADIPSAIQANVFGTILLTAVLLTTLWKLVSLLAPLVSRSVTGPPVQQLIDNGRLMMLVASPWLIWGVARAAWYASTGATYS